jgi:triacylglycerol lipase
VEVTALNDYPVVLAHGIARFDFLLAHLLRNLALVGLPLEPAADGLHYFKGIGRHLRRHGFDVAHTNVSFAAGVETRAADLRREITTLLQVRGKRKVHIIAHSMGGLDARHMLVKLDMADKVASLTTVGTPHLGTSFADWGLEHQGHEVIRLLRDVIDLGGFSDLATDACRRFNEEAEASEAANEVFYQTYGSSEDRGLIVVPLQASWDIIQQAEGANDGLVSRQSQRWTVRLHGSNGSTKTVPQHDFPLSADHLNEVGWWDFNQLRQVNLFQTPLFAAIQQYEASIQDVYREMAEEVRQLS